MANRTKQEILAALASAASDFAGAKYGEDVRASMIAIDDAVYEAIDNQAVVVDAQLSSTGFAADAKVVGDRFAKTPWYKGTLTAGTSENPTSLDYDDNGIRAMYVSDASTFEVPTGVAGLAYLLSMSSGTTAINILFCPGRGMWTRKKQSGSYSDWKGGFDASLTQQYCAADAKAVGEKFDKTLWFKGVLTQTTSTLNGIRENGTYAMAASSSVADTSLPSGATGVLYLVSIASASTCIHILCDSSGNVWTRVYSSGSWGAWYGGLDSTLTASHSAANAAAVGNILYGASDHSNRFPQPRIRFAGTVATLYDLPEHSWKAILGSTLKSILGSSFTWILDIVDNTYYFVSRDYSSSATSSCVFTIVSYGGTQKYRGIAAENNGTISWINESTDTDLTVANRPADAKAVGDALSNVQTDINFLTDMFDNVTWYKGVYTDSAPGYGDANNINTNSIYALNIGGYTYSHLPTGISGVAYIVTMTTGTTVCQIVYGSNGNIWTRIKISDVWGEWGGSIDSTLTVNHAAANASTVGNILYGDSDHTNRTPASPIRYSGTLTSSLIELPVNAWISMNGETLKELLGDGFTWASDIPDDSVFYVSRRLSVSATTTCVYDIESFTGALRYRGTCAANATSASDISWYNDSYRAKLVELENRIAALES